jgi:hypothetical protein
VGVCLIQLNDASTDIPAGCKVGLPEHGYLFAPSHNGLNQALPSSKSSKTPPKPLEKVPDGDSAWKALDRLPTWARDAAGIILDSGGKISKRKLVERGYSNRQLKQMVHGTFAIAEDSGSMLALTKLGDKVAMLSKTKSLIVPEGVTGTAFDGKS